MADQPVAQPTKSDITLPGEVSYDSILQSTFAAIPPLPMLTRNDVFYQGVSHIIAAEAGTGKSTLMQTVVHQWALDGHNVLYFTEEYPRTWEFRSRYLDLGEIGDGAGSLSIVHPGSSPSAMLARAMRGNEDIIVVDSMTNLLGVSVAPAKTIELINPWLRIMAKLGKTLIFVHHTVKDGTMAGSYALKAAFDVRIAYTALDSLRKMHVKSRLNSEDVSFLIVKNGNGLEVQETPGELTLTDAQATVYATLDTITDLTVEDIMTVTTFPEGKVRRALRVLVKKNLAKDLSSTGNVKGQPGQWVSLEDE